MAVNIYHGRHIITLYPMLIKKSLSLIKKIFSRNKEKAETHTANQELLKHYVGIYVTHQFIEIKTYSHHGIVSLDPTVETIVLKLDVASKILGQALLNALQKSRFLSLEESIQIDATWEPRYQNWIKERIKQFGYKNKYALFKYMDKCFVCYFSGKITISPLCHKHLEYWGNELDDGIGDIILPDTATPSEIGSAIRLAFRRCITKRGKVVIDNPNIPFEERKQQWVPEVRVFATPCEMEIATYSRYGLSVKDTTFSPTLFSCDASDQQLGQALLTALDQSRFLSYDEAEKLLVKAPQVQKEWAIERQAQWGYATKRTLLVKMNCCFITQSNDHIILKPSHHERLESWNANLSDDQTVAVSLKSTPFELGQALRLALTRCTSKVK